MLSRRVVRRANRKERAVNISQATAQILWESLNGVLHDLNEGDLNDAIDTIEDLIADLERAGANPDAEGRP